LDFSTILEEQLEPSNDIKNQTDILSELARRRSR